MTPSQRHDGRDVEILAHRHDVYERAKARRPERWTNNTRNWTPIETVKLNPRGATTATEEDTAA